MQTFFNSFDELSTIEIIDVEELAFSPRLMVDILLDVDKNMTVETIWSIYQLFLSTGDNWTNADSTLSA